MTDQAYRHPLIDQLIENHIQFIQTQLVEPKQIQQNCTDFCHWLEQKKLKDFISLEQLDQHIVQGLIERIIPHSTLLDIAQQLRFALIHPLNDQHNINDIINSHHVDALAQYTASKTEQRQNIIRHFVHHPAFATVSTQLIQQVLNDYFQQHIGTKHSSMGRFMKMGKSMLENVTDINLEQAIHQYLEKNVSKLGQFAEKIITQQLSDAQLYQLLTKLWQQTNTLPLNTAQSYIDTDDLEQTIPLLHQFWDHFRHSEYFKQQLKQGLVTWYARYQDHSIMALLNSIGTDQNHLNKQLQQHLHILLPQLINDGLMNKSLTAQLQAFYYSDRTLQLLQDIRIDE